MATVLAACSTSDEKFDASFRQIQITGTCSQNAGKYPSPSTRGETAQGENTITRGQNDKKDTLSSAYRMYVSAYHHPGNAAPYVYLEAHPFTCDSQYIWSASGCGYPKGGTIDFLAYAITSPENIPTATITANGTTFEKLDLNFNEKLNAIDPVVYSDLILGQSCEGDEIDPVPLNFNHATSCVQVSVDGEDDEARTLLAISDITIDDVIVGGNLGLTVDGSQLIPNWRNQQTTKNFPLPTFHALSVFPAEQVIYPLESAEATKLTLSYTFGDTKQRTFTFPCPGNWKMGERNIYRFTVKAHRVEITADAWETPWDSEIGGGSYEPDWSVETSTGAFEATWNEEIGGQGYEVTWSVEVGVTALEASWVTEIGNSANEHDWNSEIGSGANENDWNSETSGTAAEETWSEETRGSAYEEEWEEDTVTIIIGEDPVSGN